MATVSMDSSEYESMKSVQKLLESSLETERKLTNEIQRLNRETLQAYEDAKMKVISVTESKKRNYILSKRPILDVYDTIKRTILSDGFIGDKLKWIQDSFFEIAEFNDTDVKYTKTVGLDEVKSNLKKELEIQLSDEVKIRLEQYDFYQKKVSELMTENSRLIKENHTMETVAENLDKDNAKLVDDNEKLLAEIDELKNEIHQLNRDEIKNTIKIVAIGKILEDGYGLFNRGELLDRVIKEL